MADLLIFDPHFHLWDTTSNGCHNPNILGSAAEFAPTYSNQVILILPNYRQVPLMILLLQYTYTQLYFDIWSQMSKYNFV